MLSSLCAMQSRFNLRHNDSDTKAITQLILSYAKYISTDDVENSVQLFVDGGVISSATGTIQGHKRLRGYFASTNNFINKKMRHLVKMVASEISGEYAKA